MGRANESGARSGIRSSIFGEVVAFGAEGQLLNDS
jgi:hypothetical protein